MPVIRLETLIHAPPKHCFDLARDVEIYLAAVAGPGERAVAGTTMGRLGLGDSVTWEVTYFGVRRRLTAVVTACDRPHMFVDEIRNGALERFSHSHSFEAVEDGTRMTDVLDYTAPWGSLGQLADALFLESFMQTRLTMRAKQFKKTVEGV